MCINFSWENSIEGRGHMWDRGHQDFVVIHRDNPCASPADSKTKATNALKYVYCCGNVV